MAKLLNRLAQEITKNIITPVIKNMNMNKNTPETHPKVYIAIDKGEINQLKRRIEEHREAGNWERGQGIQEAINWIEANDIYTREWKTK